MKIEGNAHCSDHVSVRQPFSLNLEISDRLLIGRKLLKVSSRPVFFRSGTTRADFQIDWTLPDVSEKLIICVKIGDSFDHQRDCRGLIPKYPS